MAPRPLAVPDATAVFHRFLCTISSIFKSKHTLDPLFQTSPEEIEGIELQGLGIPSPLPLPPTSASELPTGFELKPAGPEKEPWLGDLGLQDTDEYGELVSNPWNDKHKRSIQYWQPLVVTIESAGIDALVRRGTEGESHAGWRPNEFWGLLFVGIIVVGGVLIGVIVVVCDCVQKMRSRRSTHLERPGEDPCV
ncbi:hypothetical protein B9Z19DRAFT_1121634 [Tuber borchii]|uniref:Uncharacterized protein n=1 Tax=Tuber borchii TaxID=42251 RepID=A0A2T7A292_TUBBO|nr:hypothetical protein B9Z19DRAFT_1121634 [Tuber borchii]